MTIINGYTFFWKDKIAQWNMQSFIDEDGVIYNCAEQYMMAKKALLFNDFGSFVKIMGSTSPSEQQKIGRIVNNYNQVIWDNKKEDIVYNGNILKFTQNENLFDILVSTQNSILVEASPYDKVWGVGLAADNQLILNEKNWRGLNLLGKALMKVREDLKSL